MRVPTRAVNAVLTAAFLASLVTVAVAPRREQTLLAELAVAGGYRSIEPRLSIDTPHARFQFISTSEKHDTLRRNPRLFAAVMAIHGDHGLLGLLLGNTETAIGTLRGVDLSAAYYMRGLGSGSLNDFARALQALEGVPDSSTVRFDRALILERLCDFEAAAGEWREYLRRDRWSDWAAEAREHLQNDVRPSMPRAWAADEGELLAAIAGSNHARVREIVLRHRLAVRQQLVELELLPAWGGAYARGDMPAAQRALGAARACIGVLAETGEHLLRDAIEEIDAAPPEQRKSLAKAYAAYAGGHRALENTDHDLALLIERDALKLAGDSAVFNALVSDDLATALYRKYDYAGSEKLIAETRSKYANHSADYIALFARLDWLGGLIQFVHGNAGDTLAMYERALVSYRRLGEVEYEAAQEVNVAATLTYLGEEERAAVHRRKALALASRAEDPRRLYSILKNAADSALEEAAPVAALQFQDRFVRLARATGEPLRVADALVSRSSIFSRIGRRADALRDVAEVRRLAPRIGDVPSRKRLLADADIAEALARRDVDSATVIERLTEAIDLMQDQQAPTVLAQLLLERGRAHLRLSERNAAEDDFRTGIETLEHQRRLVRDADLRVSYFDRADRLFTDLALLLLRSGRPEDAFDVIERSRSRELLDRVSSEAMTPMTTAEICSHLPKDTVVVAHAVIAEELITWLLSRDGVRVLEQHDGEKALTPLVDAVQAGFRSGQLPQRELRRLGQLLVDPAAPYRHSRIVFIPDPLLYDVPFAALRTRNNRYLAEEQTIMVTPSATLYIRNCNRDRILRRHGNPSLFAVASPQSPRGFADLPPLTRAGVEARQIAALYPRHRLIMAPDDERMLLLSEAGDYDIVHFATHSVVDHQSPARSALLIGQNGRITAAEIERAALPRVRLVILGGCNTGVGKSRRSEGAMSLARAFMGASVPVVIGTVAKVDDEAAERLLTEFHRGYSGGLNAAAALRRAQLKLLYSGSAGDAEPARWSAFEAIGGADVVQQEGEEVAQSWPLH
jgi:CHAT domain-containing protein